MQLVEITKENWGAVIMLTTNQDGRHTLGEEFVASNAYSLLQAAYEGGWTVKAIEEAGALVGFAMYGFCEEVDGYELCRFMIDFKHQRKGYGKKALKLVVETIRQQYACNMLYLSVEPENTRAINLYQRFGFAPTGDVLEGEAVYCLALG